MLVLSVGALPNFISDGINRPFIILSKIISYVSRYLLLITLRWARLLALDIAAIQGRRLWPGCDRRVCMDV